MPLILMVGLPSTGKTTRAEQLKCFLEAECSVNVHLISDNEVLKNKNINKNKLCFDPQKEKEVRGILKSEALRVLGKDNVVILDAGNYIKGYRYELYCAAKNYKTTQVTVECVVNKDDSWKWNEQRPEPERYDKESFDALHLRYEAPDSRNRWDSPLICLHDPEDIRKEEIKEALFSRKPPPPNQSTQSTPLSSSDYLYELDKITKNIVDVRENVFTWGQSHENVQSRFQVSYLEEKSLFSTALPPNMRDAEILKAQKQGQSVGSLQNYSDCAFDQLPDNLTSIQLTKLRRQFLNYTKLHPPSSQAADPGKMAGLFAQFLNSSLCGSTS